MEELIRTPFVGEVAAVCVDPSPTRPPLPPWLKSVPTLVVVGETEPRVGPGPVNNWLFERKMGGGAGGGSSRAGARDGLPSAFEERRAPLAPPVYNPDMAPRPDATARSAAPPRSMGVTAGAGGAGGKLPAAISASTPGDKNAAPPTLAGSGDDGPAAYHESEMGGGAWSDAYSFLGNDGYTAEKGYDPISRNFESLIGEGVAAGGAGGGGAGGARGGASASKRSAKEDALLREFEAFAAARDMDMPMGPMRK